MKKIILLALLGSLALALNATNYVFDNGGGDNLWSNSANWVGDFVPPNPLPSGDEIIIDADAILDVIYVIDMGATLTINTITGSLTIDGANSLTNNGIIDVNLGATLINNNDLINNGSINNDGAFTSGDDPTDTFVNNGVFNNNTTGIFTNDQGTFTNNDGATINNDGSIINNIDANVNSEDNATINNDGAFTNNGDMTYNDMTPNFTGNTIINTGSLPITLLSFDPYKDGNTVVIKWSTASEKENAYMYVQRSRDGIHFISIHEEKGHGTTSQQQNYDWTDTKPMPGVNYYRLKQVDFDGKTTFHQIESVDFDGKTADSGIYLYPTEVQNQLTIMLDTPTRDDQSTLLIVDMLGRIMQQHRLSRDAVQQDVQVGNLPQGQYFITLQSGKTLQTARFVKL